MNFCPECGTPVQPDAKFCVGCGQALAAPSAARSAWRINGWFLGIFTVILVAGLATLGVLIYQQQRIQTAREAAPPTNLPAGHPAIKLPKMARDFIAGVQAEAQKKPQDIAVWDRLGEVSLRAAQFDPSYYKLASDAYAHVLKLNPDDPPALRGVGDIDYDRQEYDEAIAAYEHYLKLKPNDAQVMVDLGTMYLYTGNPDQALGLYHKAVSIKPGFFEAYNNMGVAYASEKDDVHARAAFAQAMKYAPDSDSKKRIGDLLAQLNSDTGTAPNAATANAAPAASAAVSEAPPTTFEGQVESLVRNLPVAGPKVASVKWPSKAKALVLMNNFPMDAMPPFVRQRFVEDLTAGLDRAKQTYHVSSPVELDIADAATGRVMETISR
jgi:cytochrome c-type biogenesis protein CcmH/NrfG